MTTNPVDRGFNSAASSALQDGGRSGLGLKSTRTLEKWLSILVIVLACAWTLVMWGVYAVLGLTDEALSAGSILVTMDAQILEWVTALVGGTQQLGGALVLIAWGLGVVLLALINWVGRQLIRAFGNASSSGEAHAI